MDIEKLKRCLKCCADDNSKACNKCKLEYGEEECQNLCGYAATALSTLQAENEKLRAERVKLEQMAACVYYKQGGLCRYGEEDPANVCVFGPCPHQRSAQEVLAELEQVKRCLEIVEHQREAAIDDMTALMAGQCCDLCAVEYCNDRGKTEMCTAFKWRGTKEG